MQNSQDIRAAGRSQKGRAKGVNEAPAASMECGGSRSGEADGNRQVFLWDCAGLGAGLSLRMDA